MTSPRRFEQDVPALLADLYLAGTPDYRDDLVRQTARVRQRPAWTFPERWLPVELVTTRVPTTRMPWRQVAVLALIAALLAAALAVYVGSRPTPLPAPFGPAANGLVAYSQQGDIFTVDPATGVAKAIVTGPENDLTPIWSRDGTHIAFERRVTGTSGLLYVAGLNGTGLLSLTRDPIDGLANYSFSPDGSQVLLTSGPQDAAALWIVKTDGTELRQLNVGVGVSDPSFRPPDGAEIVFASAGPIEAGHGLYAVDIVRGGLRTILAPTPGIGRGWIRLSPDGSRIAYSASTPDAGRNTYRVHVVGADGAGDVTVPMPPAATFQDAPEWSNDGKSLAIVRGFDSSNQEMALAVVPADGSDVGVETVHGLTGCCDTIFEWAPDDTTILVKPFDLSGQPLPPLLWDPRTGATTGAAWTTTSDPAWQRVAR